MQRLNEAVLFANIFSRANDDTEEMDSWSSIKRSFNKSFKESNHKKYSENIDLEKDEDEDSYDFTEADEDEEDTIDDME